MAKWNLGLPGGPAGMFYSIVDQNGMVIVLQAGSKEIAEQIIREHEAAQQSFAPDVAKSWACQCGWSNEIAPHVCVGCGQPRRR